MAQICCIGTDSNINDVQKLNDVIACVENTHIFDPNEIRMFNIIRVSGTMAEVKAQMAEAMPEILTIEEKGDDSEYNVWKDADEEWKIISKLKYHVRFERGKFISNIQRYSENFVKVD